MEIKPKTHAAIVLDKSGSMNYHGRKEMAVQSFNEYVQQMKMNAQTQDILVSLVTFNADVYEHLWDVPVDQLKEASAKDYMPGGGTAMRDAVGYTVKKMMESPDVNDPNTSFLIVVISDGETNADTKYQTNEQIASLKEMIQDVEATKRWTISHIGCSKGYMEKLAAEMGTKLGNMAAVNYNDVKSMNYAVGASTEKLASYFSCRSVGQTADAMFCMSDQVLDLTEAPADTPVDPPVDPTIHVELKPEVVPEQTNVFASGKIV